MTEDHEDLGHDEERVARLIGTLDRRPVRLPAGVRAAVMARIRSEPVTPWTRAWRWLAAPRLSALAVGGLLAAALGLLLLVRPAPRSPAGAPAETNRGAAPATVPVRLVFLAPRASTVAVTGDFARWDPKGIPLARARGDDVWSVDLELPPGLHHYVFIVDGAEWRPDPNAASQVDDGFGQKNSVLLVAGPRAS
jgi:hypothetical protein